MTPLVEEKKTYAPHLYEPLRRKIAILYVQHEMRRLFPHMRNASFWERVDPGIEDWNKDLSMPNFWDAIHGISMGFRLTSLVPWITSLHMQWIEKNASIEDFYFTGTFGLEGKLHVSKSVKDITEKLFLPENKDILASIRETLRKSETHETPHSDSPIFVVRQEGELRVIDGNHRLMRAIISGEPAIWAMVGEAAQEPPLYEHWVPNSLLVEIVFWHEEHAKIGRDLTDSAARMIVNLVRDSSPGRTSLMARCIHSDNEIQRRLAEAVRNQLSEEGIAFDI